MSLSPLNLLVTGASGATTTCLINKLSQHPRKYNTHTVSLSKANDVDTVFDETKFDAVYLVLPQTDHCAEKVKAFLDSAKRARVPFVIFASVIAPEDLSGDIAERYLQIEAHLNAIRIPHTVLRIAPLQQNFMFLADEFHQRIPTIELPFSNGALAPIHAKDVANVAVAILDRPAAHVGRTYVLTGPDSLSGSELAGRASIGLERPVGFRNCLPSEAREHLARIQPKLDDDAVEAVLCMFDLVAAHGCEQITTTVQKLTEKPATHIEDFFREHRKLFNLYEQDGQRKGRADAVLRRGSNFGAKYVGSDGPGLARYVIRSKL